MTKRFFISVMSLLLAGTIVWARCAGCSPSAAPPEHSHGKPSKGQCCDPKGDCPVTAEQKCAGEAPWHDAAAKTEVHIHAEPELAPTIESAPPLLKSNAHQPLPDSGYSPPDLTILNSTFLI